MDDKTQQQQQRLCYFCQAPGPQFQESPNTQQHKDEKTQKCSQIWICNNCREKNNFTTSGYSCSPYDDEFCDSSDNSSDLNSTDHYLALLEQVNQQKFRLKSYWKELRLAFDLLYEAKTEAALTAAITNLCPRQGELEKYCKTLARSDARQLLQHMDKQCREYILITKRKLFGIAQQRNDRVPSDAVLKYSSHFLKCALDDWERFHLVSRAIATLVSPLEHECHVHWRTQARCVYHRLIYTNIDIHEKLRYTSNHIQQEANLFDEKKDYHYRGILRRYRKFEEHMTDAGKDRDPDICAATMDDEWRLGDDHELQQNRDLLLGNDDSSDDDGEGSESIEENISESGSSGNYEPPLDFTQSTDYLAHQIQAAWEEAKNNRIPETASISSSETTESTESDEYDSQLNPSVENYDSLLMNRALSLGDDAANVKYSSGKRQASKDDKKHDCCNDECSSGDGSGCAHDDEFGCDHDHERPDHPSCRCVHCELLGTNTKNNSDSRAANMQDRLRKKLKKRQQEQQLKESTHPNHHHPASPSLSGHSTRSRDKSEQREQQNQTNRAKYDGKRAPRSFGFGTAMEVRPVRGSTSSWNAEAYQQNGNQRFKQEIIEIASEEFRYIAERESLTVPKDSTLNSLQTSLRASIELRLDPGRQLLEEEENARQAKKLEKEKERQKREKKKKRKEEKKKREKDAEKSASISTDSGNVADMIDSNAQLTNDQAEVGVDVDVENVEDIFVPKECLDDLDQHDREVEIFKKFCLGTGF